jgi:Flp pilus assembly pilin Flp
MSDITTSAQDTARELAIRARVAMNGIAGRTHELVERAREQRGQTAAEYMGVLLLVSVIIAALVASPVGGWIADGVEKIVQEIAGGGSDDPGVEVGD